MNAVKSIAISMVSFALKNAVQNLRDRFLSVLLLTCSLAQKGLTNLAGTLFLYDSRLTKKKFWDFYAYDFFKACDYCHDMNKGRTYIPMAIQTDKTLELKA